MYVDALTVDLPLITYPVARKAVTLSGDQELGHQVLVALTVAATVFDSA